MASTVEDVLSEAQSGRVTTVFCDDIPLARRQFERSLEELPELPTTVALQWGDVPPLTDELREIRVALAEAAQSLWPSWYLSADERPPLKLPLLVSAPPPWEKAGAKVSGASPSWFKQAWQLCKKNGIPLVPHMVGSEQIRQLSLAIDPQRLVFVLSVESHEKSFTRLRGLAKAAEWLAREAKAQTILLLPSPLQGEAALDHVSYLAKTLLQHEEIPSIFAPRCASVRPPPVDSPLVLVGPIYGRPHPGSEIEQLVHERIMSDPQLSSLFEYNPWVTPSREHRYKVDLLWREGSLVVELDGPEHRTPIGYNRDRERDYRLLLAGFTILRITNDEVCTNIDSAMNKIRNMVKLCQPSTRGKQ